DDLRTVPSLEKLTQHPDLPLGSMCAAPLVFRDQRLGVLTALAHGSTVFLPGDVASLSAYAVHAAIALSNARLVERLERQAAAGRDRRGPDTRPRAPLVRRGRLRLAARGYPSAPRSAGRSCALRGQAAGPGADGCEPRGLHDRLDERFLSQAGNPAPIKVRSMKGLFKPDVVSVLAQASVAYLAVETSAGPHVTPLLFAATPDRLWFGIGRGTLKARVLAKSPAVGVVV